MQLSINKKSHALKCVWMSAGVVNYKLCDLGFDCEHCEFHRVMRGLIPAEDLHLSTDQPVRSIGGEEVCHPHLNRFLNNLLEGCTLHLDRYYHSSHLWFKQLDPKTFLMGIDPLGLKILYPVDRIILPPLGECIQKGQLVAWVVRKETTIPLYSPLKYEIIEINPDFVTHGFEFIRQKDDYLMKIEGDNLEEQISKSCGLMGGIENYTTKISYIRSTFNRMLDNRMDKQIGVTLGDGGEMESDLEKIVGKNLYQQLIRQLFQTK